MRILFCLEKMTQLVWYIELKGKLSDDGLMYDYKK